MNHEIVGPELHNITRNDAIEIAMPGQLRVTKRVSIAQHIEQYSIQAALQTAKREAKEHAINFLCRETGIEKKIMESLDKIDHNLIHFSLLAGNKEMAIQIAVKNEKVRQQHPELFETMDQLIDLNLEPGDRIWDGFCSVLKNVKP